ncbi:MAG: hypothetical protein U1E65_26460 [Myxococcota bacterium]
MLEAETRKAGRRARGLCRVAALIGAALLGACGGGPASPDAGALDAAERDALALDAFDDAEAPDLGPPDLGTPDSGPPDLGVPELGPVHKEASCLSGPDCMGGLQVTAGSESFCVDRCEDDRDACLSGFSCLTLSTGQSICVPPGGTCRIPGVGMGTACYGDTSRCTADRTACQGDINAVGYCTDLCSGDADCPRSFRCGPGDDGQDICSSILTPNAARCGQESRPEERLCTFGGDCQPGETCLSPRFQAPGVCAGPAVGGSCDAGFVLLQDLCVPERCACHASPASGGVDRLDEALAQAGLDRCGVVLSPTDLALNPTDILGDPYRFAFMSPLLTEPLRAPGFAHDAVASLDSAAASASLLLRAAELLRSAAVLGESPPTLPMPRPIQAVDPLTDALAALITETGGTPDRAAISLDAAHLSPELALAMAEIVEGLRQAYQGRKAGFMSLSGAQLDQIYAYGPAFVARRADGFGLAAAAPGVEDLLAHRIQVGPIAGGAMALLQAVDRADLGRFRLSPSGTATVATSTATLLFSQMTPIGRIAIGDGESGIYDPRTPGMEGSWALLLDLGGHDTYRIGAGGNQSTANAVSVLIDLGGRDRYGYLEVPSPLDGSRLPSDAAGRHIQASTMDEGPVSLSETPLEGGGRAGIGILVDLGQDDDVYRALRMSQGSGVFGVGVLIDEGGDDDYRAETVAQGAGAFGIGLAYDAAGNDSRAAYVFAQGFAYARGIGVSYDTAGDDNYLLDVGDPALGGDPLYPSAQKPTASNASAGQGFGFGRRADTSDRAFMSGGLGLLVDRAGNDHYRASVFAQGGGYWFGTGILADESGNDTYDSIWYGMGAAAHYSLGLLLDGGGNDAYGTVIPGVNVTIAGGHDFSSAFLIDESGDDTYLGSRITLGSGNANGRGFFADNGGADHYSANAPFAMGSAGLKDPDLKAPGSPRRHTLTIGVFLDIDGVDDYLIQGAHSSTTADDQRWVKHETPEDPVVAGTERGTGMDVRGGDSTLHARW